MDYEAWAICFTACMCVSLLFLVLRIDEKVDKLDGKRNEKTEREREKRRDR